MSKALGEGVAGTCGGKHRGRERMREGMVEWQGSMEKCKEVDAVLLTRLGLGNEE